MSINYLYNAVTGCRNMCCDRPKSCRRDCSGRTTCFFDLTRPC